MSKSWGRVERAGGGAVSRVLFVSLELAQGPQPLAQTHRARPLLARQPIVHRGHGGQPLHASARARGEGGRGGSRGTGKRGGRGLARGLAGGIQAADLCKRRLHGSSVPVRTEVERGGWGEEERRGGEAGSMARTTVKDHNSPENLANPALLLGLLEF